VAEDQPQQEPTLKHLITVPKGMEAKMIRGALEAAGIDAVEKPTSEPAGPKRTALWAGIGFSAIYVAEQDLEAAREILDAEPMSEDELVQAEEEAAQHPTQPNG
jgi:Putative prokaryotic signal transducing protein